MAKSILITMDNLIYQFGDFRVIFRKHIPAVLKILLRGDILITIRLLINFYVLRI
jgi:hypothetical protein